MGRQEWTLLALDAAGGQGLSPIQLQKSLFLLGKRSPAAVGELFYEFIPHNYGPFSRAIYDDASALELSGLVATRQNRSNGYREYAVTPEGHWRADQLRAEADPQAVKYLQAVIDWVKRTSFGDLVRAIYREYPEYRVNSVFQG